MRAYVMITGAIFGLITIAHIARIILEHSQLAADPWYILLTVIAAALCLWACGLLWSSRRSP
jgi:hypothetical protein